MITKTISLGSAILALAAAFGCGGSVTDEPNPSGAGGAGSSTTGTGAACAGFADEAGVASPTIRFKNQTGQPVYLPGGCGGTQYTIEPTTGTDGTLYNFDGSCLQTCEDLQTEPPLACAADCALVSYLIPAGSSRDFVWKGTGLRSGVSMPEACYAEAGGPGSCSQVVAANAGSYRVQATGYSACETECTCNEAGECFGQAGGAQAYPDPVKFDFPGASVVEVVFGTCAFGCPDG